MKTEKKLDAGGGKELPIKVQLVINRLWDEQCPTESVLSMMATAAKQMHQGYRLMFPLHMCGEVPYPGVVLIAKHDHRTRALGVKIDPEATHLVMCLLFTNITEWEPEADKITCLYAEQHNFPSMIFTSHHS